MDSFVKDKAHQYIIFDPESETKIQCDAANDSYAGALGSIIVKKGMKQCWTFMVDAGTKYVQFGIMSTDVIESIDVIEDNLDKIHKGYGLMVPIYITLHGRGAADKDIQQYVEQFEINPRTNLIISMELDMTQKENSNGILKYIIHNEVKDDIETVRTDDKYSNIAYDNVDINKEYRMSVSFDWQACDAWIQLVDL